jgi:hypothetical protein
VTQISHKPDYTVFFDNVKYALKFFYLSFELRIFLSESLEKYIQNIFAQRIDIVAFC